MTWWEAKEMAVYIEEMEAALDEWLLSNPEMRIEQNNADRIAKRIEKTLVETTAEDKRAFLTNLADRIEHIRQDLAERLKRDLPPR